MKIKISNKIPRRSRSYLVTKKAQRVIINTLVEDLTSAINKQIVSELKNLAQENI